MKITKRQLRRIVSEEINKAKSGRLSEMMEGGPVAELDFNTYGMITLNDSINELARQVLTQLEDLKGQGYDVADTEMYASAVSDKVFDMVLEKIDAGLFP